MLNCQRSRRAPDSSRSWARRSSAPPRCRSMFSSTPISLRRSSIRPPAPSPTARCPGSTTRFASCSFPSACSASPSPPQRLPTLSRSTAQSRLRRISPNPGALAGAGVSPVYSVGGRPGGVGATDRRPGLRAWQVHRLRHRANGQCLGRLCHRSRRLRRRQSACRRRFMR